MRGDGRKRARARARVRARASGQCGGCVRVRGSATQDKRRRRAMSCTVQYSTRDRVPCRVCGGDSRVETVTRRVCVGGGHPPISHRASVGWWFWLVVCDTGVPKSRVDAHDRDAVNLVFSGKTSDGTPLPGPSSGDRFCSAAPLSSGTSLIRAPLNMLADLLGKTVCREACFKHAWALPLPWPLDG